MRDDGTAILSDVSLQLNYYPVIFYDLPPAIWASGFGYRSTTFTHTELRYRHVKRGNFMMRCGNSWGTRLLGDNYNDAPALF